MTWDKDSGTECKQAQGDIWGLYKCSLCPLEWSLHEITHLSKLTELLKQEHFIICQLYNKKLKIILPRHFMVLQELGRYHHSRF